MELNITPKAMRTDTGWLLLIAVAFFIVHLATNGQYGFHRDELATLDDARNMEWGFVAYPPVAPLMGRLSLELFGTSLRGIRFFPTLALAIAVLISGFMARELAGGRRARILTALAVAIAPIVVIQTNVLQYVSFDYLWGVLLTYCVLRLINSENPHWWLAIGVAIGLGFMTKYTMVFFVAGVVGAVVATPLRRYLLTPWPWIAVAISLVIVSPNLLWQWQHHFISLDFLHHIHARDVRQGRTRGFLPEQLFVCQSIFLFPLPFMGLWFYFTSRKYRALGWFFAIVFVLFVVAQARSYYAGPMYPMLIAAGAVVWEKWFTNAHIGTAVPGSPAEQSSTRLLESNPKRSAKVIQAVTWSLVIIGAITGFAFFTPVAPINSRLWKITAKLHDLFVEEIGWPDLAATVAKVYEAIPAGERKGTGILVGNYGEAGSINLYGPQYSLPPAISGTNSAWYRSYPKSEPQTIIAVGLDEDFLKEKFEHCEFTAHNTNPYGVINEESRDHPAISLCHHLVEPWPKFWSNFQRFG